jgi:glyoxylase-like metal-dependent hydrolase (beta-lactamase superfamily II)
VLGKISLTQADDIRVHSYTAPEDGRRVNTHVIELATQLIVIDAQYSLTYTQEVVNYTDGLGKPITRLYITHYHPDHLLAALAFSAPIYALAEVKAKIEAAGDWVAAEEGKKGRRTIPNRAERTGKLVKRGPEVIDGTHFAFLTLQRAETAYELMVGLPDHRILIAQNLIYNQVHAFLGERAFDTWALSLSKYKRLHYDVILPGYGAPGGKELYDAMLQYLSVARDAYTEASDASDLRVRLTTAFPNFGGRVLLDHQMPFLFPKDETVTIADRHRTAEVI